LEKEWIKYYNIWVIHSILYSFSTTISITYYQAYAIKILGFDVNRLGNLTLLNLLMISLGNMLGSFIVNRYRSQRVLIWKTCATVNLIFWALTGFSDAINKNIIYLFVSVAQFSGAVGGLAYVDTIGDIIPVQESVKVFGRVNFYTLTSSVLALVISLALFNSIEMFYAYRVVYITSFTTAIASASALFLMRDLNRRENKTIDLFTLFEEFKALLNHKAIKSYILFMSLFTFFVNIPGALWNFYIIKIFNGNENWISLNTIASTLANAVGNYILVKISHRISRRNTMVYSIVPISLVPALFLVSSTMESQILLNIFSGASWSAFNLVTGIYNIYLGGEKRIYMVSLLGVLTNIFAGIATRLGATVASLNILLMNAVFIASFVGRLIMFFYARRNIEDI